MGGLSYGFSNIRRRPPCRLCRAPLDNNATFEKERIIMKAKQTSIMIDAETAKKLHLRGNSEQRKAIRAGRKFVKAEFYTEIIEKGMEK